MSKILEAISLLVEPKGLTKIEKVMIQEHNSNKYELLNFSSRFNEY